MSVKSEIGISPTAFSIAGREIGEDAPVYIVAELSANHLGEYWRAEALIKTAADAGADAVKLQIYTPDTLTIDCDEEPFQIKQGSPWLGRNLYNLYDEAQTPWEWHDKLKDLAEGYGIELFATAFDITAVDFLERHNACAYKIASFEVIDIPLLKAVGATGKPVIMSTGMATVDEISEAVTVLRESGCQSLALLHCVSAYPASPESMRLRSVPALAKRFGTVAGLSDHTLRHEVAVASVALGARIIEKHLTLNRGDGGPDAAFSLEPKEFADLVTAVRNVEKALAPVELGVDAAEYASRQLRRSVFAVADLKTGDTFSAENIRVIRPGGGLHPRHLNDILGKCAACDIKRGTPLDWDHVNGL